MFFFKIILAIQVPFNAVQIRINLSISEKAAGNLIENLDKHCVDQLREYHHLNIKSSDP